MNKTNRVMLSLLLTGVASLVAVTGIGSYRADAANSGSINFSVDLQSSATITIPASITPLQVTPSSVGTFASADVPVTAYSNSSVGYTLTMTTKTNDTFNSNLVNSEDSTITIPTLPALEGGYVTSYDGGSAPANYFPSNHWGVAVGTGNYFPATENFVIKKTSDRTDAGSNGGSATTVHLGTKVDLLATAGTYNTTVVFSVVSNIAPMTILTATTLQEVSACDSTVAVGATATLKDARDDQMYTVKKLEDGKCWMMNNLNLGAVALTATQLDNANTNVASDYTIDAATFNSWKKSTGTASYTAGEYIPITASNSTTSSATDPTSKTAYGTLYNYCAASAGTICTSSNSSNATSDLCPAGWRLPTGNTTGELQALYGNSNYKTNAKMRAPETNNGAAFALAGYFYNAAPTGQGSYGYYWSSTRSDITRMYTLYLNTSYVYPASYYDRSYGYSIRCVLK